MEKIKITLVRSIIKTPRVQKATVLALGLRRMNQSVIKEATPQIKGMVAKVNHLLTVETV